MSILVVTGSIVVLLLGVLVAAHTLRLRAAQRVADENLARALRSEQTFTQSFHESPVALAIINLATEKISEVNAAFEGLVGYSRDELVGKAIVDLGFGDPRHLAMLKRRIRRHGHIRGYTATLPCKDGTPRDVEFSMDSLAIAHDESVLTTIVDHTERKRAVAALQSTDQRLRELAEHIDSVFFVTLPDRSRILYISPAFETIWGSSVEDLYANPKLWYESVHNDDKPHAQPLEPLREFRIVRPDGTVRWIRCRVFPVRDDSGTIIRVAGVATDITDQRALEEQLRQAQKMESLGMLAGGIAHDFNNLLAVISSCSGLLAEAIDRSNPNRELVEDIADAVVRASSLTRQLLAFSRKQVTEPVVLDPNIVVNDTRKLLRRMVGATIEVVTSLEPDLKPILIDRGHLVQVILNLAVNARDAMPEGGTLSLTTRNVGDDVVLEVSDTGTGMSPEVLARACEPFFTTKEMGKGTGMGLAVVHGIIDSARGRLTIESKPGAGTTFRIVMPAFAGPVHNRAISAEHATRGVENILIVDDDDYVRRATARALRSRGYSVVEAGSGRAALIALSSATYDLLLTDIVMPGMSGRELAEAARARLMDLRILFMTGYTNDEIVRDGVSTGVVDLIEKPFTIPQLAAKVREVLDADGPRGCASAAAGCAAGSTVGVSLAS